MWKWNLLTSPIAAFWAVERLIGLAGLPGDFRKIVEALGMIPDWIGLPALTATIILSLQSKPGRKLCARLRRQFYKKDKDKTNEPKPKAVANGKETALLMLRAGNLEQAQSLYSEFHALNGKFADFFLIKALMSKLEEAGMTEDADRLYREVIAPMPDSPKDYVEFAMMMKESVE